MNIGTLPMKNLSHNCRRNRSLHGFSFLMSLTDLAFILLLQNFSANPVNSHKRIIKIFINNSRVIIDNRIEKISLSDITYQIAPSDTIKISKLLDDIKFGGNSEVFLKVEPGTKLSLPFWILLNIQNRNNTKCYIEKG